MRTAVRNRVTMLKSEITAEIPSGRDDRRAWLMIYPENGRVVLVEIEHRADLDPDSYPAPEDILSRVQTDFESIDAVIAALEARGIDTDLFDAPWKMDFPL